VTALPGTGARPLRVGIVGSGPAAFYAADHLLKRETPVVEVDMFERLPTPYGLVRAGVAPDHQKIKSVTAVFEKTAADPRFRFYGNVEFGKDLTLADLKEHYHQVLFATGAQTDRHMGIPGENLTFAFGLQLKTIFGPFYIDYSGIIKHLHSIFFKTSFQGFYYRGGFIRIGKDAPLPLCLQL